MRIPGMDEDDPWLLEAAFAVAGLLACVLFFAFIASLQ